MGHVFSFLPLSIFQKSVFNPYYASVALGPNWRGSFSKHCLGLISNSNNLIFPILIASSNDRGPIENNASIFRINLSVGRTKVYGQIIIKVISKKFYNMLLKNVIHLFGNSIILDSPSALCCFNSISTLGKSHISA